MTKATQRVLQALLEAHDRELYGAEISTTVALSSGTIHPILRRLEDVEWVTSRWEDVDPARQGRPRRRFYRLRPDGALLARAALARTGAQLQLSPPSSPGTTQAPDAAPAPHDLRTYPHENLLACVEAALRVRLDRATLVRKRRTIGARSSRGTWVRIEAKAAEQIARQGWAGVEASAVLTGIAKPEWYLGISWPDPAHPVMWRADETELVTAAPIKPGGTLAVDPGLPDSWWATLRASLAALAGQTTTRVAKLHAATVSQDHIGALVDQVADGRVDSTVTEWTSAHADLNWANLTGPDCWVLDWEDWGMAPRGLDAANLLLASLAVPPLAERMRREFAADLASRSGQVVTLALCAYLIGAPDFAGVLLAPAREEARRLLDALTA